MIESLIVNASTYGVDIDRLFTLITVIVGFWFILAEGIIFYFIIKFKAKEGVKAQYISGESKKEKRWVSIPHFLVLGCDIVLLVATVIVWYNVKQVLPEADAKIRVIGQQWAWTFIHPGPDGQIDTPDDITLIDELHVQINKNYHFLLESKDVLHSFSVPVFRLKQDAVPGRIITGWFNATKTGEYDIQCAEMCGIGHGIMGARIHIESEEQHRAWLSGYSSQAPALAKVADQ